MEEKGGDRSQFPKTQRYLGVPLTLDLGPLQPQTLDPWALAKASRCGTGGEVVGFAAVDRLTAEFSLHYLERWSHWLRSHETGIYGWWNWIVHREGAGVE